MSNSSIILQQHLNHFYSNTDLRILLLPFIQGYFNFIKRKCINKTSSGHLTESWNVSFVTNSFFFYLANDLPCPKLLLNFSCIVENDWRVPSWPVDIYRKCLIKLHQNHWPSKSQILHPSLQYSIVHLLRTKNRMKHYHCLRISKQNDIPTEDNYHLQCFLNIQS